VCDLPVSPISCILLKTRSPAENSLAAYLICRAYHSDLFCLQLIDLFCGLRGWLPNATNSYCSTSAQAVHSLPLANSILWLATIKAYPSACEGLRMACKDWDVDPSPNSTNAWRFCFRTVRTDPTAVTGRLPFAGGRARMVAMLGSDALIVERCRPSESFCTGGSRGLGKRGERRAKRHIMTAGQPPQHKAWPVLVFMIVRDGCDV